MKNALTLLIAFLLVAALVAYMLTFQVRYDQHAVRTTFDAADADDLITEPGLYFKAPWPIQKVYEYPTQLQVFEDQLEEVQTADNSIVIVKLFVAWRIVKPYEFYQSVVTVPAAENEQIQPLLRNLKGIISEYRFDQLVNTDPQRLKLQEVEERLTQAMQEQLGRANTNYGIEIDKVGITRLLLPQDTTEKVFESMRAYRERLAQNARSSGEATAASIRAEATGAADRVRAFADRQAQAIRAEGDREAAEVYERFAEAPEFATFLRELRTLREMLKEQTTFVLDSEDLGVLQTLMQGPRTNGDGSLSGGQEASTP